MNYLSHLWLAGKSLHGYPLRDRIMAKMIPGHGGCWLVLGHHSHKGYARVWHNGRHVHAHRAMYEIERGPIPNGLTIDHLCCVKHCVNPEHLEPVTNRENIARGKRRGRTKVLKTHCNNGHEFDTANTRFNRNGARACRACDRARWHTRIVEGM